MMSSRGHLFVISGPAGAGKGTLRQALFEAVDGLVYSVSCTTRAKRPGEVDGVDYHFITRDGFTRHVDAGDFLEWAEVHGNMYGTRRADVETTLDEGRDVVLEIDVQGCANVCRKMPDAVKIFIMPPSMEELRRRLVGRGTECADQLALRLKNAEAEMAHAPEYDVVIINDDVARASRELADTVLKWRNKR